MRHRTERTGLVGAGWKCLAVAGMLALAAPAPSAAQGYRTDVFVPADQNECASVPGCASVSQAPVAIPARGRTPARFWCTESHPHLWKWDVGQHEHVSVKLVAVDRFSATIEGTSLADAVGHFVVYLGCSTSPYAGSAILDSRHLAPTGWLGR